MRTGTFALILMLIATPCSAATKPIPAAEYSIDLTGDIEVTPDGSVHAYSLDEGLNPAVKALVASNIERWKFEPILVDGRAVIAKTRLRMALSAIPIAEGYSLRIDDVWFGEPTRTSKKNPPRYPTDAAIAGLGARVLLVLRIDGAGNVIEAHPEQTSLTEARREATATRWRRLFEKASIASARKWKFDSSEIIDGVRTESSSIRVPVDFIMSGGPGQWRGFIPGPITPAPWADPLQPLASAAQELDDGQVQPLSSRFKLESKVVGSVL